jgi:hypothetical protein
MNYIVFLDELIRDGFVDVKVMASDIEREPFGTGSEFGCDVEGIDFGGGRNLLAEFNGPYTGRKTYGLGGLGLEQIEGLAYAVPLPMSAIYRLSLSSGIRGLI